MPKLDLSNVEKLIARLRIARDGFGDEYLCVEAADTLEQQAAEVLRLSKEVEHWKARAFQLECEHGDLKGVYVAVPSEKQP